MAEGRAATARRLERAVSGLATAAVGRMDQDLPWYRELSADDRSWVGVIAQRGIAAFVGWFKHPHEGRAVTAQVFGSAPRELTRAVNLQQTVEMVRMTIEVVEEKVGEIVPADDVPLVHEAVLRYAREVAFAAAEVYAEAAELRGAWDARLEALVVDAVLRGEADEAVRSRAAALGWAPAGGVCVVVGRLPDGETEPVVEAIRVSASRVGLDALCATHGDRLVVVLGGADNPAQAAATVADHFGGGAVVVGPQVPDLLHATASARAAVAGLRAAAGWPAAPRPVPADDLLPERALSGDGHARRRLVDEVYLPLRDAGSGLMDTATAFGENGGSVEATARALFVHPNTVRYRLRRTAEVTGYSPTDARDAYTLRIALTLGRLLAPVA